MVPFPKCKILSQLFAVVVLWGCVLPAASAWAGAPQAAGAFSCPAGSEDAMQYFAMAKERREEHFLSGSKNPIYTQVFPDEDFAAQGYWFWLKSPGAHGFDVDVFDEDYVYLRSTELEWKDNATFKRKEQDVPLAPRCVPENGAARELQVRNAGFVFYANCAPYKKSTLGTIVNRLDAPQWMDAGGDLGRVWTRVLHYQYDCDPHFGNCKDEEQFFLAKGYGQWQWRHYRNGELVNTTVINHLERGSATGTLPCAESYR